MADKQRRTVLLTKEIKYLVATKVRICPLICPAPGNAGTALLAKGP